MLHLLSRSYPAVLLALCLAASGCVRRRLTVRTDPPGALVYVDDQEIGTSPVSTSFVYYGTRKVRVVKSGYETATALHRIAPPWYQIPPLDFLSEHVWPREIRDERVVEFELEPQKLVDPRALRDRAQQLRQTTRAGYTIPAVPVAGDSAPGQGLPGTEATPPPFYPGSN